MRQPVIIRTARPSVEETALLLGVPKSRVKFLRALAERLAKQDFDGDGNAITEASPKNRKGMRSAKPSHTNKPRS